MFVTDFQVSQGVLFVDTALITVDRIAESPPAREFNFPNGNCLQGNFARTEVLPGDAPVLKQNPISPSQFSLGCTNGTTQETNFVVEIFPGDVPWPR